jgi:acetylornithine deacetylase/succinyl-diaminopimelate desuccinylase-like protein
MAHIDVVPADPAAWTFPPFTFAKKDGFYFGRGSQDNKTGVTQLVSNFIRLRHEGYVPNRDLIMVVTGDEESTANAIEWLTGPGRELIDAEYALNTDVGGGIYGDDMQPLSFKVSTSEKLYQTYRLSVSNRGGHSSLPREDNAINQLVAALAKIADYRFPAEISDTTKIMLRKTATLESGQIAQDLAAAGSASSDPEAVERLSTHPEYNAALRTTCIATQLQAGHAENALPRNASAVVNCRIMPGHTSTEVAAKLVELVADPGVTLEPIYAAIPSPPSELSPELLQTLGDLVHSKWPEIPVIPAMSSGASDGLYVRNAGIPVYGVAGWFMHPDQDMSHGLDEKIGIVEFNEGIEFWYRLLKRLSE